MPQVTYSKVQDPREDLWVSRYLWPDCPDCQGLLKANHGPGQIYFPPEGFELPPLIPHPCPTCQERCTSEGITIPDHRWDIGPSAPYGTWPDCPTCQGRGEHIQSYSDGRDWYKEWHPCSSCRQRTTAYHGNHPTELDAILVEQRQELKSLLGERNKLVAQVNQIDNQLEALQEKHLQATRPYQEELKNEQTLATTTS